MTNTHDKSLTPSAFSQLQEVWESFVDNEIGVWRRFHEHWLRGARPVSSSVGGVVVSTRGRTLLVVRYEDLALRREVLLCCGLSMCGPLLRCLSIREFSWP